MDTETLVAPKELLEEAKKELLLPLQKELRRNILDISFERGFSHLGSCLSAVDLILSVYQHKKPNDKVLNNLIKKPLLPSYSANKRSIDIAHYIPFKNFH